MLSDAATEVVAGDARYKFAMPRSDAAASPVYKYVGRHVTKQLKGGV
jgi:hypothetical protein